MTTSLVATRLRSLRIAAVVLYLKVVQHEIVPTEAWSIDSASLHPVKRRKIIESAFLSGGIAGAFPLNGIAASSSTSGLSPVAKLSDGSDFPLCSFGLQIYDNDTAYRLTRTALDVGYRNFFASVLAGNQQGFARAIKDSGIARKDVYICGSVVSNRAQGFDSAYQVTARGCKRNMNEFAAGDIGYLDQIILDYPGPDETSIQGQWKAFEDMHAQGLVKSLGVSNFSPVQLDAVLKKADIRPVVNQLPFSVAYHPGHVVEENRKRGILVQAWAPLGGSLGGRFSSSVKAKCADIGARYDKSFAQVALRWILQQGASFTTQSQKKNHFSEDLDIFDFELTDEDMSILSSIV